MQLKIVMSLSKCGWVVGDVVTEGRVGMSLVMV